MRFVAVDTLTGRILRPIQPTNWELQDPLRDPGTGRLTVPKPVDLTQRASLREATRPRRRWIAAQDDQGRWVWGGPIHKRPSATQNVTVPLVDWRSWFYRARLRPLADGSRNDYFVANRDQTLIADDLFRLALNDTTPDTDLQVPPIVVDAPLLSEVNRRRSARQLDGSIGDVLDTLVDADPGIDWWTYVTPAFDDPTRLEVHVTSGWPERSTSSTPISLVWQEGEGGNVADVAWPEAAEAFSRVWATGDGEPPAQAMAWDEDPEADVLWEGHVGPLDGVSTSETAYEHAFAERSRSKGRESHAEVTLIAGSIGLGEIGPGDRARLRYDDGWEAVDVEAARIVARTMSGGAGRADRQVLTLDLSDTAYPDAGETDPGTPGVDEEA